MEKTKGPGWADRPPHYFSTDAPERPRYLERLARHETFRAAPLRGLGDRQRPGERLDDCGQQPTGDVDAVIPRNGR